jgi:hypothetical protein
MKLDVDTKQRISTGLSFILEFYKVLMGTFLIAFVPQSCDDHVCSITENIQNTDSLHLAGNICNLATFVAVLEFYRAELKRENWCIHYLDIDHDKPTNNLDDEIEAYPEFKTQMKSLNSYYLNTTYIAIFMLMINFALSSVAIGYDYVGTNTLTSLLSFFILVVTKVSSAYSVGKKSVLEEHALSAYLKTAKTYNTIDVDFRKDGIKIEELPDNEDSKTDNLSVSNDVISSDGNSNDESTSVASIEVVVPKNDEQQVVTTKA